MQTNDGGYTLFGLSESGDFDIKNPNGSYDFWVVKLDATGVLVWEQAYGGSGIEQAYDAVQLDNGDFIIVGQGYGSDGDASGNHGGSDAWVLRINSQGGLIWQKMFGGSDFEFAQSITQGPDNTYFVSGNSRSSDGDLTENFGENDLWVFQITDQGDLLWQKTIGGSGIDVAQDAVYTTETGLVIAGTSHSAVLNAKSSKGLSDLVFIKLQAK